jgi:hypothetical protein
MYRISIRTNSTTIAVEQLAQEELAARTRQRQATRFDTAVWNHKMKLSRRQPLLEASRALAKARLDNL